MLNRLFDKVQKVACWKSNSISETKRDKLIEPKSLKRRSSVKTFTTPEDIRKNGSKYFDSLSISIISPQTFNVIHYYTGGEYEKINAHERNKSIKKTHSNLHEAEKLYENKSKIISKELLKHVVKENIFVFKGIDVKRLELMGKAKNELSLESLRGKVIRDRGFVSTSLLPYCIFKKDIMLKIKVPVGAHAAYIADISIVHREKELLLDRDQSMVITDIKRNGKLTIIECELLEKTQKK